MPLGLKNICTSYHAFIPTIQRVPSTTCGLPATSDRLFASMPVQVVVPPVPLAPEEMEAAVRRFKAMERRPRLSVVKAEAAESAAKGVVAGLASILCFLPG